MKEKKKFNVIVWNFNRDSIDTLDVLPYFRDEYKRYKKSKRLQKFIPLPTNFLEMKSWVERLSSMQYWARCEYEIIVEGWPIQKNQYKLDVHQQVKNNLDIIAEILCKELIKNDL